MTQDSDTDDGPEYHTQKTPSVSSDTAGGGRRNGSSAFRRQSSNSTSGSSQRHSQPSVVSSDDERASATGAFSDEEEEPPGQEEANTTEEEAAAIRTLSSLRQPAAEAGGSGGGTASSTTTTASAAGGTKEQRDAGHVLENNEYVRRLVKGWGNISPVHESFPYYVKLAGDIQDFEATGMGFGCVEKRLKVKVNVFTSFQYRSHHFPHHLITLHSCSISGGRSITVSSGESIRSLGGK